MKNLRKCKKRKKKKKRKKNKKKKLTVANHQFSFLKRINSMLKMKE